MQRFGYETSQIHGRFIKGKPCRLVLFGKYVFEHCAGDLRSNEFVCGSRDGCIRLWDVRSFKVPFVTVSRAPEDEIHLTCQITLTNSCLVFLPRKLSKQSLTSPVVTYWRVQQPMTSHGSDMPRMTCKVYHKLNICYVII